jgi:hypothetical protein
MVRVGEPGETIVTMARQKHCGEIVLGSRGLGNSRGACTGNRSAITAADACHLQPAISKEDPKAGSSASGSSFTTHAYGYSR